MQHLLIDDLNREDGLLLPILLEVTQRGFAGHLCLYCPRVAIGIQRTYRLACTHFQTRAAHPDMCKPQPLLEVCSR